MANMNSSTAPSTLSHTLPAIPFESKLSEQLLSQQENSAGQTPNEDNHHAPAPLQDSPKIDSLPPKAASRHSVSGEPSTHSEFSKDDSSHLSILATPTRPAANPNSLSLHPPLKLSGPVSTPPRAPLSPTLDSSQIHNSRFSSSPGSVLPRRSRGLDFSRACTNLHHSTLAESSPESSPTIGGRGVAIPGRRGSPGSTSAAPFSTSGPVERTGVSSSVSSVNMLESDTSSGEEDDEPMGGDKDDMILNTPQATKSSGVNPFAVGNVPSPGNEWMGGYSHAAASLMSFQRARFRKGRSRTRHSSSSASGNSSKPSPGPGPLSPPPMKSIENPNWGYFGSRSGIHPRRESLSMGTRDLRLSDLSDDGEGHGHSPARHREGGPLGVIRRAVARRGSLLPKTKTFARIKAALSEESAPIDSEAKREAEVIRQVRESDPTPQKSPDLLRSSEPSKAETDTGKSVLSPESTYSDHSIRNWTSPDDRYRTPPPPIRPAGPPSVSEDDLAMDMTPSTTVGLTAEFARPFERPSSQSSTRNVPHPTPMQDFKRKRGREEDFDPNLFKRRAVSPSMSAQSSPVMPNSPALRDTSNIWVPPKSNIGTLFPENSNRSNPQTGTLKRVGLQGMTETNDSLMNMSIE